MGTQMTASCWQLRTTSTTAKLLTNANSPIPSIWLVYNRRYPAIAINSGSNDFTDRHALLPFILTVDARPHSLGGGPARH